MVVKVVGVEEIILGLGNETGTGLKQNPDEHKMGDDREEKEERDQGD